MEAFYSSIRVPFQRTSPILCLPVLTSVGSAAPDSNPELSKLYSENCAICHGDNLQGGLGRNFLMDEVKSGGRVRHVRAGPDGLIYVALNAPDKIVRLAPAEN